ncbi:MAG: aspartate dehydrogenase [Hyphomicrobiales bacterium]|nr:aspartate dehydrogenase [Hyphomicrobiales bacterium]
MKTLNVAVGGLGAIGLRLAQELDRGGIAGLTLAAVSARDPGKAAEKLAGLSRKPEMLPIEKLAEVADVVVECVPARHFRQIAAPTVERGRIFVPLSVGQLIEHMDLVDRAASTGARIMVPTGALLGLDAVRAAAEGTIASASIVTRKPPKGLAGAPLLVAKGIDVGSLEEPVQVFRGSAREAIKGFPANVNVAVALALAGIGPDRTTVEIWADPGVERNTHTISIVSDSSDFTMTIAGRPTVENPATGRITAQSVIALLRRLSSPLVVGS